MLETQNSPPPQDILEQLQQRAAANLFTPAIADVTLQEQVDYVCRCLSNRAGVRLLMACLLAKLAEPHIDPRKPYTEIGDSDSFSGRTYDERYITPFINH
ncbi:MAG: DNA methyltransferase, partial [Prochlorothrix sp.]